VITPPVDVEHGRRFRSKRLRLRRKIASLHAVADP